MKELRTSLLKGGQHAACKICWDLEKQGLNSKRILDQQLPRPGGLTREELKSQITSTREDGYLEKSPPHLELKLGTICNLMCRMCSSVNSSSIFKEQKKMRSIGMEMDMSETTFNFFTERQNCAKKVDFEELKKLTSSLKKLNISGGEPLLNPMTRDWIRDCVDSGLSKNIMLDITSNATSINPEILSNLQKFKSAKLFLSVDGIDSVFEYIRYPGQWDEVSKNCIEINSYRTETFEVILSPTSQVLNALSITDVLNFAEVHQIDWELFDYVVTPAHLDLRILPNIIKKLAYKRIQKFHDKLDHNETRKRQQLQDLLARLQVDSDNNQENLDIFFRQIKKLDGLRNQKLETSIPELWSMLKSETEIQVA